MSRRDLPRAADYLRHIPEAIANIREYTSGLDFSAFKADRRTQDAVVRNFEVIGEACNNIAKHHVNLAAAHPKVPWGFAYEMRNALSHGYFKIDQAIVWRTIQSDLPELEKQVQAVLDDSKE